MKIGNIDIGQGIILAPMEAVTDIPFRLICKRMGADHVYTEFIASDALVRDIKQSLKKMEFVEEERPISIQIFGSNREAMTASAKMIEDSGADIVDINYGCWVSKVVKNNSCAAYLKDPERMAEMTKFVVDSVSIPVTVKTRLGWDSGSIVMPDCAQMLEEVGIKAISIHCRTRAQGMKDLSDWSWLPKIKEKLTIPVILNGDVRTAQDAKRAFDTTNCDAVMIGRGAIGNPFIFREIKEYLATGKITPTTVHERLNTCLEHLKFSIKYKGFPRGFIEFRKHYTGYMKGLYNSSVVRQKLVVLESLEEVETTFIEYLDYLEKEDKLVSYFENQLEE